MGEKATRTEKTFRYCVHHYFVLSGCKTNKNTIMPDDKGFKNEKHEKCKANGYSFVFPVVPIIRVAFEEIVIQQVADFEQKVGINPLTAKNLIGVLPRIAQLYGKPCNASPLPCQFCLDEFPYVRFFVHRFAFAGALRLKQTKWAEPF